jgi:hypothetical protein
VADIEPIAGSRAGRYNNLFDEIVSQFSCAAQSLLPPNLAPGCAEADPPVQFMKFRRLSATRAKSRLRLRAVYLRSSQSQSVRRLESHSQKAIGPFPRRSHLSHQSRPTDLVLKLRMDALSEEFALSGELCKRA